MFFLPFPNCKYRHGYLDDCAVGSGDGGGVPLTNGLTALKPWKTDGKNTPHASPKEPSREAGQLHYSLCFKPLTAFDTFKQCPNSVFSKDARRTLTLYLL